MSKQILNLLTGMIVLTGCMTEKPGDKLLTSDAIEISGIYPHLAFYNEDGE